MRLALPEAHNLDQLAKKVVNHTRLNLHKNKKRKRMLRFTTRILPNAAQEIVPCKKGLECACFQRLAEFDSITAHMHSEYYRCFSKKKALVTPFDSSTKPSSSSSLAERPSPSRR